MNQYYIYRIEQNGEPKKKQTTHAHTLDSAWNSNKGWYTDGLFLVTNADGSEADIFNLPEKTASAAPPPLRVCYRCLLGIECKEGKQITREIHLDDDEPGACDWCEDDENDVLYEIL